MGVHAGSWQGYCKQEQQLIAGMILQSSSWHPPALETLAVSQCAMSERSNNYFNNSTEKCFEVMTGPVSHSVMATAVGWVGGGPRSGAGTCSEDCLSIGCDL